MIDPKELKQHLLPLSEEIRMKLRQPHLPPLAVARYDAVLEVLGNLFIFLENAITKGERDMDKLKDAIKVQIVKIGEIEKRHYKSEVDEKVLGWIKELRDAITYAERQKGYNPETDKPALRIDPAEMKPAYLNTKIAQMREDKKVPETIRVMQRQIKEQNGNTTTVAYLVEIDESRIPASRR